MFILFMPMACVTPQHTVQINDYILLQNGKEVLGREQGLTAFVFENDQTKEPFSQYVGLKYNLPKYNDVEYWVTIEGYKFKVYVYENDEVLKYFNTSQFIVSNLEPDVNVRSQAKFIAISVINASNEDCLDEKSLYHNMVINYLRNLKKDFYNS